MMAERNLYLSSLFGGSMAGLSCDLSLYPLDTIKTRLQAPQGFLKSGGFSGIYRGIGPLIVGTAPHSALYFCTYEAFKSHAAPYATSQTLPFVHMIGGSLAEIMACLLRVPMEVVKQRRQTIELSAIQIAAKAYHDEGVLGLYRGYASTLIRDLPFSFIQFPIWEYLKVVYQSHLNRPLNPIDVANCGAIAGGFSAILTTPLDVVKTRIMLAEKEGSENSLKFVNVLRSTYKENGMKGLFAGFVPRVLWITIGSYIFFGVYDYSKHFCNDSLLTSKLES